MSFDATLPLLINEDIRAAVAEINTPGLGAASYLAPAASVALPFILSEVSFSGGASVETTEYPFYGGWSSEALNEKPQSIKVKGSIGGANVLARRNDILNALRVATSDDKPGYIVLPSWGRFPVVVVDWDVSETMDKQGLFPLSLTFTRAGLSAASRQVSDAGKNLETARAALKTRAIRVFADELTSERLSVTAITSGFVAVNAKLLAIIGRIQSAQSTLNAVTNSVLAVTNLINQGISAPFALATAFFASIDAIVAAALGTANETASVFDDEEDSTEGADRNARNVALAFLANATFSLDLIAATPKAEATRAALQNLYRAASLFAASGIIPSIPEISYDKFKALYDLLRELEESVARDDPDLATACTDVRIAVSDQLRSLELYHERTARFAVRQPILAAAASLGLSYERFRSLNPSIRDEFAVIGAVSYV